MDDPNNNEILDIIFDDEISEILAEMEDSPKTASELSEKFHLTHEELDEKLSKLVTHEFVTKNMDHDDIVYSVDGDKISKLLEGCLLYTSPSPRDKRQSRMPSSA